VLPILQSLFPVISMYVRLLQGNECSKCTMTCLLHVLLPETIHAPLLAVTAI
jgi:hypothetical protein